MDLEKASNSSLDTFVIKYNEQKTYNKQKQQSEKKLTNSTSTGKTIIAYHHTDMKYTDISQEIHVDKQESKCSIYINTTVCEQKSNYRKISIERHCSRSSNLKSDNKKSKEDSFITINMKNRITPKCFRRACTPYKNRIEEVIRNKVDYHRHHLERRRTKGQNEEKKSKYSERRHRHNKKTKEFKIFSPISSSQLKEDNMGDNLTYEDLSTASLEIHAQKPMSYKSKFVKKCKHCGHVKEKKIEDFESKLDTLIRRTKERERKLAEQSRRDHRTWFTSTPLRDCNSEDIPIPCEGLDVSIGSQSTLILENKLMYSPISSADLQSSDKLSNSGYSPGSPNQDYSMKTIENNNNYKLDNVKIEPMVDVGAYSPVGSPDTSEMHFQEKRIKNEVEIKTESLFSSVISPIYFENDTSFVQCCKIESNTDD